MILNLNVKKWLSLAFLGVLLGLGTLPLKTEARSGCCSHHGGVCGCGCCDGSGLSATCAPYYPWCNDTAPSYPQPKRCPSNSSLAGDTCYCNNGYALFRNSCVKIPTNAHESTGTNDAWECDYGYIEKGNGCIPKPIPVVSSPSSSLSSLSSKQSSSTVSEVISSSSESISSSVSQAAATSTNEPKKSLWHRIWSALFGS